MAKYYFINSLIYIKIFTEYLLYASRLLNSRHAGVNKYGIISDLMKARIPRDGCMRKQINNCKLALTVSNAKQKT